jgi:hypothetical protein
VAFHTSYPPNEAPGPHKKNVGARSFAHTSLTSVVKTQQINAKLKPQGEISKPHKTQGVKAGF